MQQACDKSCTRWRLPVPGKCTSWARWPRLVAPTTEDMKRVETILQAKIGTCIPNSSEDGCNNRCWLLCVQTNSTRANSQPAESVGLGRRNHIDGQQPFANSQASTHVWQPSVQYSKHVMTRPDPDHDGVVASSNRWHTHSACQYHKCLSVSSAPPPLLSKNQRTRSKTLNLA